jgi:glycosyltransferase involved in cell wall biosynthesis
MRLLVDVQGLQTATSRGRGIGRYARSFLHALAAARPEWSIEALENAALERVPPGDLPDSVRTVAFDPPLPITPATRAVNERYLGDWLASRSMDVFLELSLFEEHALLPVWADVRPTVAAIAYDLIPALFHSHYLTHPGAIAWYGDRLRQFADTDLALAISEATRQDVLRLMGWPPSRVVTILGATEHKPRAVTGEAARARLSALGIDRPFVVCVGGADDRKNMQGTLAAFAALPPQVRASHLLVIVCALSDAQVAALRHAAERLDIDGSVRFTRFVSDDDLHLLYEQSRASLFLSFYEGLGLPVLESLRAGTPVVASNRSSVPEFCDSSSALVDPADPVAAARALETMLARPVEEGRESRRAHAARFTWARTAAAAAAALERMPKQTHTRRAARPADRLRVAWVSPLPPTRSGISDYSVELLERMPPEFEISFVVAPHATVEGRIARGRPVLRPHDLDTRAFDLCVFHLGNSAHHLYMLDLLRRQSGLLVLHDLFVGGLALHAEEVGAWPGGLARTLESEGEPVLAAGVRRGEADHRAIAERTALSAGLIARSEAVVVHSVWSWRRVRAAAAVPVFRIPHGIPEHDYPDAADARRLVGIDRDAFLIVTLGEVTSAKRVDQIIAAMHRLPERVRSRAQLRIVGAAPADLASELLAQAGQLRLGDQVAITGRVSLAALAHWAVASSACVQLRHPFRGETSGATLRALAAGAACIVSDEGSLAEIPISAALRVPVGAGEVEALCGSLTRLHDEPRLAASLRETAQSWMRREGSIEAAAARYAAAIHLTAERRRRRDGAWLDAACTALSEAAIGGAVPADVLDRWAALRTRARAPAHGPAARRSAEFGE